MLDASPRELLALPVLSALVASSRAGAASSPSTSPSTSPSLQASGASASTASKPTVAPAPSGQMTTTPTRTTTQPQATSPASASHTPGNPTPISPTATSATPPATSTSHAVPTSTRTPTSSKTTPTAQSTTTQPLTSSSASASSTSSTAPSTSASSSSVASVSTAPTSSTSSLQTSVTSVVSSSTVSSGVTPSSTFLTSASTISTSSAAQTSALSACANDPNAVNGLCGNGYFCDTTNVCAALLAAGATCSANSQCQSAQCVSGVCSGPSSGGGSHTNAGAIAGGVVGGIAGIALFAALFLFFMRRRNQAPKRFNRGRGITPSMIFTDDVDENGFSGTRNSGGGVRRTNSTTRFYNYGFAEKHMSFGSGMPPLAADTRAAFDAYYGIGAASRNAAANHADEQVKMETTAVPREVDPTRQSTSSARLSKYNYLTKAFSQLRTSYAPSQAGRDSMTLSESDFQQQMTYNSRKLHQNVTNMNLNNSGHSGEGHPTASTSDNARSETTRDSNPLSHHDSLLLGLEDFVLQPLDAAKQADRYKMRSIYSTYSDTLPRAFNDDALSPPPFAPPSYTAKETQAATPILKQFASSNLDVMSDGNARVSDISRGSGFLTLHAPLFKSHEADISPESSPTFPKRYSPTTVPPIRSPSPKSNDGPTSPQALTPDNAQNQSNQPSSPGMKPEEDEAVPRPTGNGANRGISLGDEEIIDPIKPMRPSDDSMPKATAPPGHALPDARGSDAQSDMTSLDRSSSHLAPSPIGVVRDSIISDVSVESDYNPFRKLQSSGRNYGYF